MADKALTGQVLKFTRPRKETVRGAARSIVTDATRTVKNPCAVIVFAMAANGDYALRSASDGQIHDFDKYSRAISVMQRKQAELIE